MDNFNNAPKNINYPILIFCAFQILFFIIAISSIFSLIKKSDRINVDNFNNQPNITISNLQETIPTFPSSWVNVLQNQLLNIVQANDFDVNISDIKAEVRSNTTNSNYFSFENFHTINAIVDLPELNQSYQFFFEYSDEENNSYLDPDSPIIFLCITDPDYIIYPDFNCTDLYSQKNRQNLVARYLKFFEFDQFRAALNEENLTNVRILPYNFDDVDADLFISETKQAIRKLGISPDLFDYDIVQAEEIDFYQGI